MNVARYDLIVIGGGPAGEKGAAQAACFGKRVALIERGPALGGTVANGSIPFKALRETALYLAGFRTRQLHGVDLRLKEGATLRDFLAREQALVRNYRFKVASNGGRGILDGTGTLEEGVINVPELTLPARTARPSPWRPSFRSIPATAR